MKPTKESLGLMPEVLPYVQCGDHRYFVDLKLHQFRNTENPRESIDFDSDEGRRMCMWSGVITCPRCGISTIVLMILLLTPLHCVSCGASIGLRNAVRS